METRSATFAPARATGDRVRVGPGFAVTRAEIEITALRSPGSRGSPPRHDGGHEIHEDREVLANIERAIVCFACGHAVTRERARIQVNGAHAHVFKNPSAIDYRIGCFSEAQGCAPVGEASTVWTWFPGHAWQIAVCGRCGVHLGWSFTDQANIFWGLILDRLA